MPFFDFAATVGPAFEVAVIAGLLVVPCVIVWLVLKKPPAGKDVSVTVLGKLVKVDVKGSTEEQVEKPVERSELAPSRQKRKRPSRGRRR